jgi:GTPase SAR1 family protein
MKWFKCLVIGSGNCGKTSLINTFMSGFFRDYVPYDTVRRYQVDFIYNRRETTCEFDNEENHYSFKIYDFDLFKPVEEQFMNESELEHVDVIILCYLATDESKLDLSPFKREIENKWSNVPVLLVGCLSDLLKSSRKENLVEQVGAQKHLYCSSLQNFNVKEIFTEAFKVAIYRHNQEKFLEINHETNVTSNQINQDRSGNLSNQKFEHVDNSFALTKPFISYDFKNRLEKPLTSKLFKSLFSLFSFACLALYLLAYHYCYQNSTTICGLFREFGFGSLKPINQTYSALFKKAINFAD